ncbi:hypothetical protein Scep_014257 [Stephania cephalantha]|uniref:Uncharacterized protein n=1 Tax=Stephania cephalantha TaxID=152367 RepID=A0AAP0P2U4_9MAGN
MLQLEELEEELEVEMKLDLFVRFGSGTFISVVSLGKTHCWQRPSLAPQFLPSTPPFRPSLRRRLVRSDGESIRCRFAEIFESPSSIPTVCYMPTDDFVPTKATKHTDASIPIGASVPAESSTRFVTASEPVSFAFFDIKSATKFQMLQSMEFWVELGVIDKSYQLWDYLANRHMLRLFTFPTEYNDTLVQEFYANFPWTSTTSPIHILKTAIQRRRIELTQSQHDTPIDENKLYLSVVERDDEGRIYGLGWTPSRSRRMHATAEGAGGGSGGGDGAGSFCSVRLQDLHLSGLPWKNPLLATAFSSTTIFAFNYSISAFIEVTSAICSLSTSTALR